MTGSVFPDTLTRRRIVGNGLALTGLLAAGPATAAARPPGSFGQVSSQPKLTLFLPRDPALGNEAWVDSLLADKRSAHGLAALAINLVDHQRTARSPYDGVVEMHFHDAAALHKHLSSTPPVGAGAMALVTTTVTLRRPPRDGRGAKRFGLVARAEGTRLADFVRDWRDVHGPDVDKQPGLSGYQLNLVDGAQPQTAPWDGYAEFWWPDWRTNASATEARLKQPSTTDFFARRLLLMAEQVRRLG